MIDPTSYGIIYRNATPELLQAPVTHDRLMSIIYQQVAGELAYVYRYPDSQTVWYMVLRTPWVGDVHVFSEEGSSRIITSARGMFDNAKERGLSRVEARTHNRGFLPLAKRCGMTLEGIRQRSFRLGDTFVDEYEMGRLL